MRPSLRVSGNAMEVINMDVAGGSDLPNGVGNNRTRAQPALPTPRAPLTR